MNILLVGGGGREHALAWKIAQSPQCDRLFCAPGNPGIAAVAECVPVAADDVQGLVKFAAGQRIDLVVVGPEGPLVAGLTDLLVERGVRVFGPTRSGARLEGSKAFCKALLKSGGIPTASFRVFDRLEEARAYLKKARAPVVVKADGLCAGKGVVVCTTRAAAQDAVDQMLGKKIFGEAGASILIEEGLSGEEGSILAVTDGRTLCALEAAQDHKRVFDADRGPNTGGMGAYSPTPFVEPSAGAVIEEQILLPTLHALRRAGIPYRGVLYAGLMMTANGPKVLEYNCRFGDPETQPVLLRMKSDLVDLLEATASGTLEKVRVEWDPRPAVCVVLAAKGYPGTPEKGHVIEGLGSVACGPDLQIFHAGTAAGPDGKIVTAGGRVLGVTAKADTLAEAVKKAYDAVGKISFEGMHYRKDIAKKALDFYEFEGRRGRP